MRLGQVGGVKNGVRGCCTNARGCTRACSHARHAESTRAVARVNMRDGDGMHLHLVDGDGSEEGRARQGGKRCDKRHRSRGKWMEGRCVSRGAPDVEVELKRCEFSLCLLSNATGSLGVSRL